MFETKHLAILLVRTDRRIPEIRLAELQEVLLNAREAIVDKRYVLMRKDRLAHCPHSNLSRPVDWAA